jgi:ketosteroid isomerase-like protein
MAVLDEEIEWHEPDVDVPWRGVHRGHDGFVSWLHIIGRELADLVVQPHEFIAIDDTVVVLGQESARDGNRPDLPQRFHVRLPGPKRQAHRLSGLSRHRRDDPSNSGLMT